MAEKRQQYKKGRVLAATVRVKVRSFLRCSLRSTRSPTVAGDRLTAATDAISGPGVADRTKPVQRRTAAHCTGCSAPRQLECGVCAAQSGTARQGAQSSKTRAASLDPAAQSGTARLCWGADRRSLARAGGLGPVRTARLCCRHCGLRAGTACGPHRLFTRRCAEGAGVVADQDATAAVTAARRSEKSAFENSTASEAPAPVLSRVA